MGKLPYIQWYVQDFERDMTMHPLEIAGAWVRILGHLHQAEPRGRMELTVGQWGRMLGVGEEDSKRILDYLQAEKIAEVTFGNTRVTVMSRRMCLEEKAKESGKKRVSKHRANKSGNDDVTPESRGRDQRPESRDQNPETTTTPNPSETCAQEPPAETAQEPQVVVADEIRKLRARYQDQDLVDQTLRAFKSTRKHFDMSPNLVLAELQWWAKYPEDHVRACMQVYLDGDHAGHGRAEKYLRGIIRNHLAEKRPGQGSLRMPAKTPAAASVFDRPFHFPDPETQS